MKIFGSILLQPACSVCVSERFFHLLFSQQVRLRNDLYCVEWDVKLYYTTTVNRSVCSLNQFSCVDLTTIVCINLYYASAPRVGALSDDARLTSVCLLRTSGLSREQRSLGRLKLTEVAHITRDSDTTFKVKRSKVNLQELGAYCGGLQHSLF